MSRAPERALSGIDDVFTSVFDYMNPGEELLTPEAHGENDVRNAYGYEIYPIREADGTVGRSVFLVVEPGGSSEPVTVVGDATFAIRPVIGKGILMLNSPRVDTDDSEDTISAFALKAKPASVTRPTIEILPSESYAYVNQGSTALVIRDDSFPDFKPEYEAPSDNEALLAKLAELGITASAG
jgi:hypothetical protein